MSKPDMLLWFSDNRGQYIPRDFAECFLNRSKSVSGVSEKDWAILEAGPDHEWYWDAWCDVCDNAVVTCDGVEYRLWQDGDLWLVPDGMTWDERFETFTWGEDDTDNAEFHDAFQL